MSWQTHLMSGVCQHSFCKDTAILRNDKNIAPISLHSASENAQKRNRLTAIDI